MGSLSGNLATNLVSEMQFGQSFFAVDMEATKDLKFQWKGVPKNICTIHIPLQTMTDCNPQQLYQVTQSSTRKRNHARLVVWKACKRQENTPSIRNTKVGQDQLIIASYVVAVTMVTNPRVQDNTELTTCLFDPSKCKVYIDIIYK